MTCYTGALCGLGCNSRAQEGIFPDHDIEVTFDVKFDVEDIIEVMLGFCDNLSELTTLFYFSLLLPRPRSTLCGSP